MMLMCLWQEDDAKQLVRDAIAAGIFNDLGSGSNIDLCVITKSKVDYIRPHDEANKKGVRWELHQFICRLNSSPLHLLFLYHSFIFLLYFDILGIHLNITVWKREL